MREGRLDPRHRHHPGFGRGGPFDRDLRDFDLRGGPRGRRRRGDIRTAVLAVLDEQPRHGYEVIQALEEKSEGAWRPSAGSVYPMLQQLEDEGLARTGTPEQVEQLDAILTDARKAIYRLLAE
jgi:hypothetical protein